MFSPTPSNILQYNTNILEEQQQLQAQLKKVAEVYCVKCAVQKARKVVEAKAREEAKKQRIMEEKKKKK